MVLSVCPTFFCKNRCKFCYLGHLRESEDILSINALMSQLKLLSCAYAIDCINIFGGDITLLDDDYVQKLLHACKNFAAMTVTTNKMSKLFPEDSTAVSLNMARLDFDDNIQMLADGIAHHASVVVDQEVLELGAETFMNMLPSNASTVTFQRCTQSIYNKQFKNAPGYDNKFQDFILQCFSLPTQLQKKVMNCQHVLQCLDEKYDPTAKSNLFLLPNGKLASVSYIEDREYFKMHRSLEDFEEFVKQEDMRYKSRCLACQWYGHCYAEHLDFNVKCSGCKKLLDAVDDISK